MNKKKRLDPRAFLGQTETLALILGKLGLGTN